MSQKASKCLWKQKYSMNYSIPSSWILPNLMKHISHSFRPYQNRCRNMISTMLRGKLLPLVEPPVQRGISEGSRKEKGKLTFRRTQAASIIRRQLNKIRVLNCNLSGYKEGQRNILNSIPRFSEGKFRKKNQNVIILSYGMFIFVSHLIYLDLRS